ncbi:MAG TPA: SRPBCC family protein [Thermoanaerobaculia bacterium]|nr:SRPBCC family protein [Thermoanaerobaculia bacterium]
MSARASAQPFAETSPAFRPVRKLVQAAMRPVNLSPSERWMSAAAGAGFVALGLTRRRAIPGAALTMIGAGLFWRGFSGHSDLYGLLGIDHAAERSVLVDESVTVNRPAGDLYRYWRNLENLPRVFSHLMAVREIDSRRSQWAARAPAGAIVEWEAEIVAEREGEVLSWRTVEGSDVVHRGSVRFRSAPGERGTVVSVSLEWVPPAGPAGRAFAKLLGEDPGSRLREDLRRFKQVLETGEVPSTEGQPSGRTEEK